MHPRRPSLEVSGTVCAVHGPVGSQVLKGSTRCCFPVTGSAAALPLPNFVAIAGVARKIAAVHLDGLIANESYSDVVALGALDLRELKLSDWQSLPSWKKLLPLHAGRL